MSTQPERHVRYERKFAVAHQCRAEVEQLIRNHRAGFREIFQQRAINNIYFDSADARHLRDSVEGATNRLKVRIRWYGELFGNNKKPVLEFKWKHGLMVSKDSFPLEPFELARGMSFQHVTHLMRQARVPDSLRDQAVSVKPVLVNRYVRKYFLSADKRFRVTVDDRLCYYRIRPFADRFFHQISDNRHIIVEMKYARESDLDADRISGEFPFRLSRWSKFVAGLEEGYDG